MGVKINLQEFEPCAACACFNIRKASRVVTQLYDEVMQETGLRGTQFSILAMIAGHESLTITLLADKLVMDRTTLTRNLKPLKKQGLINIIPGEDRRTRAIRLTHRGYQILTDALPLWKKAQQKISQFMGQPRLDHLINELGSLEKIAHKS